MRSARKQFAHSNACSCSQTMSLGKKIGVEISGTPREGLARRQVRRLGNGRVSNESPCQAWAVERSEVVEIRVRGTNNIMSTRWAFTKEERRRYVHDGLTWVS